jgi:hypothetical protein
MCSSAIGEPGRSSPIALPGLLQLEGTAKSQKASLSTIHAKEHRPIYNFFLYNQCRPL